VPEGEPRDRRTGELFYKRGEDKAMMRSLPSLAATGALLLTVITGNAALAQTHGGVLKLPDPGSPANMSMLELPTIQGEMPMMGVFNNLILFDQHKAQVSLGTIVPDLATEWSWSEDGTELTFNLRRGVKFHDGKPFTAADVKCTWDLLLDKTKDKLRLNPRKSGYDNLAAVITNGDYEVSFQKYQRAISHHHNPATQRVTGLGSKPAS
jgi:peptide/nickel transport system substrate-binding protein